MIRKSKLAWAFLLGFLINLPFMIMEWVTQSDLPRTNFPFALFIYMCLAATLFIFLVMSILKDFSSNTRRPFPLLLKGIPAVLLAWSWITLVIDQMPCFLGASGC